MILLRAWAKEFKFVNSASDNPTMYYEAEIPISSQGELGNTLVTLKEQSFTLVTFILAPS